MKKIVIFFLLILTITPVKAEIELKEGLNIIAIDLGGEGDEEERKNGSYGDAAIIEQNGKYLLIDVGNSDLNNVIINYLESKNITKFSIYISHYHYDHYGKIKPIVNNPNFEIEKVYLPNPDIISSKLDETKDWYSALVTYVTTANNLINYLTNLGIDVEIIEKGKTINIGEAKLNVIWDFKHSDVSFDDIYNDGKGAYKNRAINDTSLVSTITYKDKVFLTAGDIEGHAENDIINSIPNLKVDILKFSHHGSIESNTEEFINDINPIHAYIPNNASSNKEKKQWLADYKESYKEVTRRLTANTNVLSTSYNGNIHYNISKEGNITWETERNYKTLTVSYLNHNNNEIDEKKEYQICDRAPIHFDKLDYLKEIKDYVLIKTTNDNDNYILENDIEIKCYYEKLGDMNKDGTINFGDVIIALRKYLNIDATTEEDIKIGDMNNTKEIEFGDIITILRIYLGIE